MTIYSYTMLTPPREVTRRDPGQCGVEDGRRKEEGSKGANVNAAGIPQRFHLPRSRSLCTEPETNATAGYHEQPFLEQLLRVAALAPTPSTGGEKQPVFASCQESTDVPRCCLHVDSAAEKSARRKAKNGGRYVGPICACPARWAKIL